MDLGPLLIASLLMVVTAALVTPGISAMVRRPPVLIFVLTAGVAAAACVLVGNARWGTFGRAFERAPIMTWLLVAGAVVLIATYGLLWIVRGPLNSAWVVRVASLLPIVALSLPPRNGAPTWQSQVGEHLAAAVTAGNYTFSATFAYDMLPNAAMYLPAAFVWAGILGSVRRTVAVFAATSVMVELYQAAFTDRVAQVTDVVGNSTGALVGAVLYFVVRMKEQPDATRSESRRTDTSSMAGP